jgi:hypothetical protein
MIFFSLLEEIMQAFHVRLLPFVIASVLRVLSLEEMRRLA